MNREILFKAKRLDNGKWETGYYFKTGEKHMMLCFFTNENGLYHNMYEIDPKTLCQYTGLTDKNGKKIWENDVCKCEKRGAAFSRCIVKWNQTEARFDVNAIDCNFPMTLEELMNDISIKGLDYEVIGNIFDNPELLEG